MLAECFPCCMKVSVPAIELTWISLITIMKHWKISFSELFRRDRCSMIGYSHKVLTRTKSPMNYNLHLRQGEHYADKLNFSFEFSGVPLLNSWYVLEMDICWQKVRCFNLDDLDLVIILEEAFGQQLYPFWVYPCFITLLSNISKSLLEV